MTTSSSWLVVVAMVTVGNLCAALTATAGTIARQPAEPSVQATVLASATIDPVPSGSVDVSAVAIVLATGIATAPFTADGPLLVIVERGRVSLMPAGDTPDGTGEGLARQSQLDEGSWMLVQTGDRIRILGMGTDQARILMVALRPAREPPPPP